MMGTLKPVLLVTVCFLFGHSHAAQQYLGKFLGKLSELHHGVSGEVYAVDARTLHLKDFTYDGEGPAAYFWAGSTRTPGAAGFRVRDENGSGAVLKRYRRKSLTLTLPEGKTLNNIKWFSVWCEEFAVNFGDVKIPRGFDYPKPQKVDALRGVHGVSSDNVVIVDAQTLLIPNFSYDGEAPDAKFWVGLGSKPSPQGTRIPDENGKEVPLRRYDHKTVVLTLPGDLTVFDIGHFGVWCEAFTVDFGHVRLPPQMNVPPSLKMLGVSPQSKLNCEVLYDNLAFEVRWAVAGESIVLQLVAKLDDGEYMSFGVSGDDTKTVMVGGDVVVAWVDKQTLKGYAQDYYLEAKSQCSGPRGSCPDDRLAENTNNIRLLNAAMVNGYSIVTYQRPLKSSDELDREIFTNRSQAIIWAVGPLNQRNEVSFHSQFTKKDHLLDFGRPASWNCPIPEGDNTPTTTTTTERRPVPERVEEEVVRRKPQDRRRGGEVSERRRGDERVSSRRRASTTPQTTTVVATTRAVPTPRPVSNRNAWHIPPIECYEPDDGVFYAQLGPTGGKRGYPAITGHVGWGISWYINGLLIPVINVVRGKTYTFITEGGLDPEIPAKYHPFYITDDPIGGYEYKTPEERQSVQIFAGVKQTRDGKVYPTGVGRLCHWTHTGDKEADDFDSFGAYQRTLELRCDAGEPGVITWTPDADTPDTVYYQCFTHRYLGWKINVLDSCDTKSAASEPEPQFALPDNGDLKSSSSILVETRINPNDLFQTKHTKQISDRPAEHEDEDEDERPLDKDYSYHNNFHSSPELYPRVTTTTTPTKYTTTVKVATNTTPSPTSTIKPKFIRHPPKPVHNKMRRPFPPNYAPPFVVKPFMLAMRRPPPIHFKKPIYRIPFRNRSVVRPQEQKKRKEPVAMNQFVLKSVQPSKNLEATSTTEKYSSQLIAVKKELSTLRPAINTGFHPESVVIEGGFKPIIKEIQKRISLNETDDDENIGVIKLSPELNSQQYTEYFEPIFKPSPPDRHSLRKNLTKIPVMKKAPSVMVIVKHVARSAELETDDDDEIAMAAERVESYYLPPDNKRTKPIDRIKKPSNIDIPPGTVVTFDGRTVSGVSLTAPVLEDNFKTQSTKATEYLRQSPQFGPFRGEIPPLETQNINVANLPQLSSQAVISRDLNAPAPTSPQTTRLSPIRLRQIRNKRYAHHTPEHTLEQQKQTEYDSEPNKSSYVSFNFNLIYVVVFTFIHKYFINH